MVLPCLLLKAADEFVFRDRVVIDPSKRTVEFRRRRLLGKNRTSAGTFEQWRVELRRMSMHVPKAGVMTYAVCLLVGPTEAVVLAARKLGKHAPVEEYTVRLARLLGQKPSMGRSEFRARYRFWGFAK